MSKAFAQPEYAAAISSALQFLHSNNLRLCIKKVNIITGLVKEGL